MRSGVVCDTGPLVAMLNARDGHHSWVKGVMAGVSAPLVVCEPVVAEAWHLLQRAPRGQLKLVSMLRAGLLRVGFSIQAEATRLETLLSRYSNVPMSLADACVVRMAELAPRADVLTLDSDFLIYRTNGREALRLLAPFDG